MPYENNCTRITSFVIIECLSMAIQFEEQNFDLMSNLDELYDGGPPATSLHTKPQTNKESQS